MQPFYELSLLTQKHDARRYEATNAAGAGKDDQDVEVIQVKTVGPYEVAILPSKNPSALADWLAAHQFSFPKEKQNVLDQYIQQHWFFVAARINPEGNGFVVKSAVVPQANIPPVTRKELASGELHPIIISFPSEKCIFPLAISSVNGTPSEISLYVLSSEPLVSPVVFESRLKVYKSEKDKWIKRRGDRKRSREGMSARIPRDSPLAIQMNAEDPNDPPPGSVFERYGLGAREPDPLGESEDDFYS